MNAEIKRQLNFLASMPAGSTTMKDADVEAMLLEVGDNMLARGSLYNFVVTPIGAGVSRITLALANPIPRATVVEPQVDYAKTDPNAFNASEAYLLWRGQGLTAREMRIERRAFIEGWKAHAEDKS